MSSSNNGLPKNRLSNILTSKLIVKLNKIKVKSLNEYLFAKILNEIGNILNINVIFIKYDELRIRIIQDANIFSDNLRQPSRKTRTLRSIRKLSKSVSRSVSRSLRRHNYINNNKYCFDKSVIGEINTNENPTPEEEKKLFNEFNNFINNNNCLDLSELRKRLNPKTFDINEFDIESTDINQTLIDEYMYTLCFLNNNEFTNKKLEKLNKPQLSKTLIDFFTKNLTDELLKKEIEDIIEFYLILEPKLKADFDKIKIPAENDLFYAQIAQRLKKLKEGSDFSEKNVDSVLEETDKELDDILKNLDKNKSKNSSTNNDYVLSNNNGNSTGNSTGNSSSRKITKKSHKNSSKLNLDKTYDNVKKEINLFSKKLKLRNEILKLNEMKMFEKNINNKDTTKIEKIIFLLKKKTAELEELEKL